MTRVRSSRWVRLACASSVLVLMGAACSPTVDPPLLGSAPSPTAGSVPAFSHVVVVTLENTNYDEVFGPGGAAAAPYLNSLADQWALATQYYGVGHASLTNYIAMTSGQTPRQVTEIDCPLYDCSYPTTVGNIADQVEASGRTWKGYMDGMPTACAHGAAGSVDPYFAYLPPFNTYATRHNPFMYYDSIVGNPSRCVAHDVPYSQLATDLAANQLPDLSFISPDLCNDGHEDQCGVHAADNWLSVELPKILGNAQFQAGGVVFVTFDEAEQSDGSGCCGDTTGGGRVGTIVISPTHGATGGFRSATPHNHYSLLRTIEDAWHLDLLGHAQDASITPMTEFFPNWP